MDLEQFQFSIAGFNAVEAYPFAEKIQRYFTAFHSSYAGAAYRIVTYPLKIVQIEPLLAIIAKRKAISNPLLPPILHIYPQAQLLSRDLKCQSQKVIAVVYEESPGTQLLTFFDFVLRLGPISEKLALHLVSKLLSFVSLMNESGLKNCFACQDLFFNFKTGDILLDGYGDRTCFKLKSESHSDAEEIGSFLFTCLKTIPPFRNKVQKDPHYSCLLKGQFQKFWSLFAKPYSNPSEPVMSFINSCFIKGKNLEQLNEHEWIKSYKELTEQEVCLQIREMAKIKKQAKEQQESRKKKKKEDIMKSIRERNSASSFRNSSKDEVISVFLEKLGDEETHIRPIFSNEQLRNNKLIEIAYLLTQISLSEEGEEVRITNLCDKRDTITFQVKADLEDNREIDCFVEIDLRREKNGLPFAFRRISGEMYDCIWVRNYLTDLCLEI